MDFLAELTTVLRTGADIEREVKVEADQKSHAVLMRIRAYRMADGGSGLLIGGIALGHWQSWQGWISLMEWRFLVWVV